MGEPRRITIPYAPRPQQQSLHDDPHRFKVLVAHRRFGKTVFCLNELIKAAALCQYPQPRFAYLAPFLNQAKDITWTTLKHLTEPIPGIKVNESDLWVELPGERRIRIYGADNAERLRGGYLDGVVVDEYAQMNPKVWDAILQPMLSDRLGWAIFIGTPLGRNSFADLYTFALSGKDSEWAGFMFKASETSIIDPGELVRRQHTMTPDLYAQEYECSFDAAVPGAYYATLLTQAEQLGRVKPIPYEPSLAVHTGWDLGIGDPTAIWFAQIVYGEPRLIDYYENSGVGLDHYVAQLKAGRRSDWIYGMHFFPHDVQVKELGTGMSRVDTLKGFGLHPTVLAQSSVDDGVSQVRFALRKTWIDSINCAEGLKALRQYRSEWDGKRMVLKPTALHDWTSHCADAARYLFIGLGRYMLDRQPLVDPALSSISRAIGSRPRFADGRGQGGRKPVGW